MADTTEYSISTINEKKLPQLETIDLDKTQSDLLKRIFFVPKDDCDEPDPEFHFTYKTDIGAFASQHVTKFNEYTIRKCKEKKEKRVKY